MYLIYIVWFQDISIPTPGKVFGNSEGEGVSKIQILKGKYEAKLEILVGRGIPTKIPSMGGGMDIWNHTLLQYFFLKQYDNSYIM